MPVMLALVSCHCPQVQSQTLKKRAVFYLLASPSIGTVIASASEVVRRN
jgi:hypothetical protein